jgi:hypothetical protein
LGERGRFFLQKPDICFFLSVRGFFLCGQPW